MDKPRKDPDIRDDQGGGGKPSRNGDQQVDSLVKARVLFCARFHLHAFREYANHAQEISNHYHEWYCADLPNAINDQFIETINRFRIESITPAVKDRDRLPENLPLTRAGLE